MGAPVFSLSDVSIRYRQQIAVDSLSLELAEGSSLGLIGANGAGKTSTIRSVLGLLKPNSGRVQVFGSAPGTVRSYKRIGYAPEDGVPAEFLTGAEYLSFVASFRVAQPAERKRQVDESLNWFELAPEKKIKDYSKGMRRRIVLAQAFLGQPDLLILDEPLNGLDPLVIIKLRDRMDQYRAKGGTLLFSSHILAEVEKTCTHVAILRKGVLTCAAPVGQLVGEFGSIEAAFAAKVGSAL